MVAVTGANGLLGSFIVRALCERGVPVVALHRRGSDVSSLDGLPVEKRVADVTDSLQIEEALQGVTKVVHAAAIVSYNPRMARAVMDINVRGTRLLINECLSRGIGRFVHVSSVAALGRQRKQRVIDESNQWVDGPHHTVYGESKYLAELEVFRAQEEGMSTVIVNPSVILSPGDWNRSSARLFRYVGMERRYYADAWLNYVDVRDVAGITVRLLDKDRVAGQRLIVNAGSIAIEKFFSEVARRLGKTAPGTKLGKRALGALARAEAIRTWFTGEEPLISRETARLAGADFFYDNSLVRKTLSVDFQPIDKTLDWCCEYYLKKYMHKK